MIPIIVRCSSWVSIELQRQQKLFSMATRKFCGLEQVTPSSAGSETLHHSHRSQTAHFNNYCRPHGHGTWTWTWTRNAEQVALGKWDVRGGRWLRLPLLVMCSIFRILHSRRAERQAELLQCWSGVCRLPSCHGAAPGTGCKPASHNNIKQYI